MTAINVLKQSDRVWLATDGAALDDENIITHLVEKQWCVPGLLAVLAIRGKAEVLQSIRDELLQVDRQSVHKLACDLGAIVSKVCCERQYEWHERQSTLHHSGADFDLVLVGWSEVHGPFADVIQHRFDGQQAQQSKSEVKERLVAPFTATSDAFVPSVADVDRAFIDLMTDQRASFPVGGFIDLTCISVAGVETRRIQQWPDAVGGQL